MIYYSTGGYYSGVFDLFGEDYMPCLSYASNSLFSENPFARPVIKRALAEVEKIVFQARCAGDLTPGGVRAEPDQLLSQLAATSGLYFSGKKARLASILEAEITVLPPDSRHVDYDVVPLIIADGCLYQCDFCSVKAGPGFKKRSRANIVAQLEALSLYYGADLANCNSLFMKQHDSLAAADEDILFAARAAYHSMIFILPYASAPAFPFWFGTLFP